uniref:Ras GTPase-activating protein-binding protein 1 n=1 Tax=Lygus hesperus TaxID=30085 RepID=A0A0A9VZE7_LYGHE
MVMEQTLSPQCVGREFVRQYYTLLNEAPAHLHRFYNNSSSFIHGEPDANNRETVTVVGQRQIHQRIQELNFRDCHAKITQVDSQATLGNAVVVQVTGELSNNGQPMRRFTQTFVLASQNPKKYYVHNDIFRYQDLLLDEDIEGDMARSDLAEEDQEQDVRQNEIRQNDTQPEPYYTPTVNGTAEPQIEEVNNLPPTEQHISQQMNSMTINSLDMIQPPAPPMGQQDNGPVLVQNSSYVPEPVQEPLEPVEPQQQPQVYHTQQVAPQQPPAIQQQQQPQSLGSSEPKTYATLVKTGTNLTMPSLYYNSAPPPAAPPVQAPQPSPPTAVSPPPAPEPKPIDLRQNSSAKPQRNDVGRSNYSPRPTSNSDDNEYSFGCPSGNYGGSGDAERRRMAQYTEKSMQYPDSNQLFIGNVPVSATEPELRELFGKFGAIVDLRILSKGSTKSSGNRVPNYGFIIFEDQSAVQAVLTSKPIMFPNDNGVKLNVEEKKAKRGGGGGEGGGRGGARGGGGMMRSSAGPMGGSGAGRGGSGAGRGALRSSYGPNPIRPRN